MISKKLIAFLFVAFIVCLFASSNAGAYPFIEVEGFVGPYSHVDNGDGTSTFSQIDYIFRVTTADLGAEMRYLSLEFESDVFASPGTLTGINPADWSTMMLTSSSGNVYQIASAGTTLGEGETLSFSVMDAILYNDALVSPKLWQEGQIWGQSFVAGDTRGGYDGGSTTLAPEPGTLFLLSSGMLGAGYYMRRKTRRGKKHTT